MKSLAFALYLLAIGVAAKAEDRLILTRVSGLPLPGGTVDAPIRYTVSGAKFRKLQGDVESVVGQLGNQTEWWDTGPDASYDSLEIYLGSKRYVINSWYPLYRDNPKLAVSETTGLVPVSGAEEKRRIEFANSARYKLIVGLFDEVRSVIQ